MSRLRGCRPAWMCVQSSGFVLLDRAARDAVMGWHFLPAVQDGQPIPFDMTFRVVFQLD